MNIEIDSVAELPIDELETLQKNILVHRITVLGHYKTSVSANVYKQIYRKLQELTEGIEQDWSNTKKFVLIYSRVARNIEYDYIAAYPEEGNKEQKKYSKREVVNCRNLKNGLLQGKCVCAGYAEILRNACLLKGVPAIEIDGPAGSGNHAWNQVQIDDGKWIEVDSTWDHNSVTDFIGTDKQQIWKSHGRHWYTIVNLINSEEHEVSNFDLTAFINEEFGLDMQYSSQEQKEFISLLDKRDAQGQDITQELKELIESIQTRQKEEKEFEQECGYTIQQLTELGFSNREIEEMQANYDEETGEKIDRREAVQQYLINKSKQKQNEQEFEQECGYTIEQLVDLGFDEAEIRKMQANYDSQTRIKLNRREIVKKRIEEKEAESTNEFTVIVTEEEKESLKLQCQNLHPQTYRTLIKEIENGYISFEEACLIINYKKGNENRAEVETIKAKRRKIIEERRIKQFEQECGYTIEQLLQMGFSEGEIEIMQINYDYMTGEKIDRKKVVEEAIQKKYSEKITLQEVGKGTVENFKNNVQRAMKTVKDFIQGVMKEGKSKDKDTDKDTRGEKAER